MCTHIQLTHTLHTHSHTHTQTYCRIFEFQHPSFTSRMCTHIGVCPLGESSKAYIETYIHICILQKCRKKTTEVTYYLVYLQ